MNSVENKNQIVRIAGNVFDKYDVYVVNGKVIVIRENALDLDDDGDVKEVFALSSQLYENKFLPAIHGKDTICVLGPMDNHEYVVSMTHITNLPEDVQEKVKAAIEEYHSLQALYEKNQIVDVGGDAYGGNVYVINKKPVYIYPGAIDLGKSADVDEICRLVCDADMAESLNCFGEDTMLVLGTEPEDGYYNISIGDIETLPDGIQKKVRLFTK